MERVLVRICIYGRKAWIEEMAQYAALRNGEVQQMGQKARRPPLDLWCYCTPWDEVHFEELPDGLNEGVLRAISRTSQALAAYLTAPPDTDCYGCLLICPVGEGQDWQFSCLLPNRTVSMLATMGLALEIDPAVIMPERT